jgi:ATP-dependent helicase HrpA
MPYLRPVNTNGVLLRLSAISESTFALTVTDSNFSLNHIEQTIPECMSIDQPGFSRRIHGLKKRLRSGKPIDRALPRLEEELNASTRKRAAREENIPTLKYPEQLPVSQRREEIIEAIRKHQVIVLCGETGSGKTTQLPKLCLEAGRGTAGLIGHTQPRRIAARSVATRIAEELGSKVGETVGYKVRFSDHTQQDGYIKLMTDGILLAEIHSDPELRTYDTIIIDEAHERSLNIDFLLGFLKQLLPRRPDLRLIITSATIDPERLSEHFNDAPILQVSGRSYPVEIRYRPLVNPDEEERDRNQETALLEAVDELAMEGPGDILIFLPGEREIREYAESLRKHHPPHTEILPLYARLSAAEQNRVFATHSGRRIILSTNVAETSLTVPGIRYVIDTGSARISRYSWRAKVQRLHIEPISQASANQRSGRCGRVAEGICIRLYGEDDYENRPEFTDAEVVRTNLAAVILQMANLGLGEVEQFPFVDPPDSRLIKDGYKLLFELGAVDNGHRISKTGRQLARLPIDPRLGRMLIEGHKQGVLAEILIITSSLAIQDPRERPQDKRAAADQALAEFSDERSDFLTRLNIWTNFHEQSRHLSNNKLRRWCRDHFLSYLRMREWLSLHKQLRGQLLEMGYHDHEPGDNYDGIHQALLTGLLDQVGFRHEDKEYLGVRDRKFRIFPASGLARKGPKWIMASQMIDTGRLYAHEVASIKPEWIERYAGHLLKRHYSEPFWQSHRGQVAANERITLYGLTINPKRRINFGAVDPVAAREIFIRHALVMGEYRTQARCIQHNREFIADIEDLEARSRRRDLLIDEDQLFRFYDQRIPADIHNGPAFERWYKKSADNDPLLLSEEQLIKGDTRHITEDDFPSHLVMDGIQLPLSYHFEPGNPADGVTLQVPLVLLKRIPGWKLEWLVPGLLEEKLIAMIRSLPKAQRKNYVPAPDFARACFESMPRSEAPLADTFAHSLTRMTGVPCEPEWFTEENLPEHLRMRITLMDEQSREISSGRSLEALQQERADEASKASEQQAPEADAFERDDITAWDFGTLPDFIERDQQGYTLKVWPALIEQGKSVGLRVFDTPEQARQQHHAGLRRLFMLQLSSKVKELGRQLPHEQKLCLLFASTGTCQQLKEDLLLTVFDRLFMQAPLPENEAGFIARCNECSEQLKAELKILCDRLLPILEKHHELRQQLRGNLPLNRIEAAGDIAGQLDQMIYRGFVLDTPAEVLQQMPRYLKAIKRRLERLDQQPDVDRAQRVQIEPLWSRYLEWIENHPDKRVMDEVTSFRWQLEELRVSLFAQSLGTPAPVSIKRLEKQWREISKN